MTSQPPVSDQSPRLTTRILRELLTRPEKDGSTLKELSQLHHDVLRLGRDVACVPNRQGQEVLIPKMDLYESTFSNLLRVIDRMPQMKVIIPVLEDCWYGYQACCAQVFSSLSAEIHELKHQVDFFHEDLSDLQHLGNLCLSKIIEQDEKYPGSGDSSEKIEQEQINAQIDDLEQQNHNLTEEVQRLAGEIDCLRYEKEGLEANISSLSAHVEDCEALNALQTPRPTTSLSDLVYILGDESTASLANEMASEVFEKHHNPIEFIERGMQFFDEGEEDDDFVVFREKYASIFECEYNSNDLSRAIIRRFGTTQEKFKILESSYIDLMRENHDLICQVAAFEEIEQKRSMARRRYQEKSQAEKKGIIQTYLDMLAEKGEDSWKDQLIGMGTGIEVPKLFRFGGKVRNKHMSKRETEKLVREVWKGRMAASSGVKSTTLVDFLGNHLQKKVGISAAVLEVRRIMVIAFENEMPDLNLQCVAARVQLPVQSMEISMGCRLRTFPQNING
jgi:molecular chaperone GrpE (heat shock protein)